MHGAGPAIFSSFFVTSIVSDLSSSFLGLFQGKLIIFVSLLGDFRCRLASAFSQVPCVSAVVLSAWHSSSGFDTALRRQGIVPDVHSSVRLLRVRFLCSIR